MKNSKIEWTDHTLNFWVGCAEVSPACAHCYARTWAIRAGHPELWAGERRRTQPSNWHMARNLDKGFRGAPLGRPPRVFTNSLADFFDNAVPEQWRVDAWDVIRDCPNLRWQILTKRPGNIARMLPPDWGTGWPHVWLGTTVVNQEEADRDWPKLARVPAVVRFLSMEPLLGPVSMEQACDATGDSAADVHLPDWIIVGGESGGRSRPMHPAWVYPISEFCGDYGIPFFFKQWGEWAPNCLCTTKAAHAETPRPEPGPPGVMFRCGKVRAGREFNGMQWDEFPDAR